MKFVAVLFLLFGQLAYADLTEPLRVAIFDSPIDYEHPAIAPLLDIEALQNTEIKDSNGEQRSLWMLNQRAFFELQTRLDPESLNLLVSHYDQAFSGRQSRDDENRPDVDLAKTKVTSGYLHGTHVAESALRSATRARLINFVALPPPEPNLTTMDLVRLDSDAFRPFFRSQFRQYSLVLKRLNVRIANLSFAYSRVWALKTFLQRTSEADQVLFKRKLEHISQELSLVFAEELERFINENPKTIFVNVAGNKDRNPIDSPNNTIRIEAKNLIKVTAMAENGLLANFANHSSSFVDIAARGTCVEGAQAGGGYFHLSGGCTAAPVVTRALVDILERSPSLSVEAAIARLYSQYTAQSAFLQHGVRGGRYLKPDFVRTCRAFRSDEATPQPQLSSRPLQRR